MYLDLFLLLICEGIGWLFVSAALFWDPPPGWMKVVILCVCAMLIFGVPWDMYVDYRRAERNPITLRFTPPAPPACWCTIPSTAKYCSERR